MGNATILRLIVSFVLVSVPLCFGAFLQEQLPLRVVITTPVELLQGLPKDAVQLSGSQALTVRH